MRHLRARLVHVSFVVTRRFVQQRTITNVCFVNNERVLRARRRDHAAAVCQKCEDTFSPGRLLVFCFAILFVVVAIGGAFMWLARLDKMREHEHHRTGRQHAHIVQRKLGNKVSIVIFTFQVIYQYSDIVTGHDQYFH